MDVLFLRDFRRFSGGHLKVWHYFGHLMKTAGYEPWVRFTEDSVWDESNPWNGVRERVVPARKQLDPELFFLAGTDWLHRTRRERKSRRPVINLIQHVRHADPEDVRFTFLGEPAVRICVGPEVASAIAATGRVRGPVFTIPNAVDLVGADHRSAAKEIDLLVVAYKNPGTGSRVNERLRRPGRKTLLLDRAMPRRQFLDYLGSARVTVFLPAATEGFYLPALEGMALGTLVVCPDCIGNRSFCHPGRNCFRPEFDEDRLVEAAEDALGLPDNVARHLRHEAAATARAHDPGAERDAFLGVVADVERLWTPL